MSQWQQLLDFPQASPGPYDFASLCLKFEKNHQEILLAYNKARSTILATLPDSSRHDSNAHLVSDCAREERQPIEFCLARLLEMSVEGIRGASAADIIIDEVELVSDWENVAFISTVPAKDQGREIFRTTIAEKCWAAITTCLEFLQVSWVVLADLYKSEIIVRWGIRSVLALVVVWVVFYAAIMVLKSLLGITIWPLMEVWTESMNFVLNPIRVWIRTNLQSPPSPPPRDVGFPSMALDEGISMVASQAMQISDVAANLSIIPQFLQISRANIIGAADIISASTLEFKDSLATAYSALDVGLNDLTVATRKYNIGADMLMGKFETLLETALERVAAINGPLDFLTSFLPQASWGCVSVMGFNWGLIRAHRKSSLICGSLVATTILTDVCLKDLDSLVSDPFCDFWLTNVPGNKKYMEQIVEGRVQAVRALREFLVDLNIEMGELFDAADHGKLLCMAAEVNFRKIRVLHVRNDNEIKKQMKIMEMEDRSWESWKQWIGFDTGLNEKRADLINKNFNLSQTIRLHGIALELFSKAKDALETWADDIDRVMKGLDRFESYADKGWRGAWQNWNDWKQLRDSFEGLKPVLETMVNAHAQLRYKSRDASAQLRTARELCVEEARASNKAGHMPVRLEECLQKRVGTSSF